MKRHPFSTEAQSHEAHLRIISTTDLHVHVYPYDYYTDRPVETFGLSRTASLIRTARAEAANCLLVDNGDYLQGNPMGDFVAYEQGMREGDVHPIIQAMNLLDYDAGTLGNHEFNYGMSFLDKVNAGANFPILCANLASRSGATPRGDKLHQRPYTLLKRQITLGNSETRDATIGIIGFVTPQVTKWDQQHLTGYVTRDIVKAAQAWVPEMKEAGADVIIALSHSGISSSSYFEGMENASLYLAGVEGIDAVVTGHHHLVYPSERYEGPGVDGLAGTLFGKPATMAGFWGSHIGLIDLKLASDAGQWRVTKAQSGTRSISTRQSGKITALVDDQPDIRAALRPMHEHTLKYVRQPLGETALPLHSYFSLIADCQSVRLVNRAQTSFMREQLKNTAFAALPLLSAAAPFKAGGRGGADYYTDVPAGPLALKNAADLYLYPNSIRAVHVDGALLKDWLERSACIFNQVSPGSVDTLLHNPAIPSYNFDTIYGLSYEIDLSQPAKYDEKGQLRDGSSKRIFDLKFNGKAIEKNDEFIVATNSYRLSGGGTFPSFDPERVIFESPVTNRDVIARFIVDTQKITQDLSTGWKFAAQVGSSVLFQTGPSAIGHLRDLRGIDVEPLGTDRDGFLNCRLNL